MPSADRPIDRFNVDINKGFLGIVQNSNMGVSIQLTSSLVFYIVLLLDNSKHQHIERYKTKHSGV